MAFYVKMSSAPGECAREAMRQGLGVSAAVAIGYTVVNHDHRKFCLLSVVTVSAPDPACHVGNHAWLNGKFAWSSTPADAPLSRSWSNRSLLDIADLPPVIAKAWLQSWKWAAITVAVVTSPVIGKVAKVSFERFLGTIAGEHAHEHRSISASYIMFEGLTSYYHPCFLTEVAVQAK